MRRSANLSAEKLVRDYLGRVSSAAQRVLPKGDRLLFVGRTRAAIEKRVGPLANADPAEVAEMLAELGDPLTMVKAELERLETAHRGGAPPPPVVIWKPAKEGWKPSGDDWSSGDDDWKPVRDDTEPIPLQPAAHRPGAAPAEPPPPGPPPPGPPLSVQASDQAGGPPSPVALAPPRPSTLALARSHPLETIAVLLLGVGGLILPPVWLAGGLVAAVSRIWDAWDKWLAMLGPPLFVLAGLLIAGLDSGHHGFFGGFIHAFDAYRDYLIRGGAVLTAGYLAWRIRRGPRMRSLPPWQRPRRGPTR
jgi:hypothetical protein